MNGLGPALRPGAAPRNTAVRTRGSCGVLLAPRRRGKPAEEGGEAAERSGAGQAACPGGSRANPARLNVSSAPSVVSDSWKTGNCAEMTHVVGPGPGPGPGPGLVLFTPDLVLDPERGSG